MILAAEGSGTLGGSALASWAPVDALLLGYLVVVAVLWWWGGARPGDRFPLAMLQRIGVA